MKKLISFFLALVMILGLFPFGVSAAGQAVTWSGAGGEVRANVKPNNTVDYELSFDLHLPGIGTSTGNGKFADDEMLKIRETVADHYVMFRIKSYRNNDGDYQILGQHQFYNGNWSAETSLWSEAVSSPISDVRVKLAYDSDAGVYTWSISTTGGKKLCDGETDASLLSDAFKSGSACELAFKRDNNSVLPTNTTYTEESEPEIAFDSTKSPADFGWETDDDNFKGWSVTSDGSVMQVSYDGTNSKRVWKELLGDGKNFTVSLDVQILARRVELELLGTKLELNCEGGNGNQIYTKDTDWFNASRQKCSVTISRENGGDLTFVLKGDETRTVTHSVKDEESRILIIGVIDDGGSARFGNIRSSADGAVVPTEPTTKPVESTEPTEPTVKPTDPTTKPVESTEPIEPSGNSPEEYGWKAAESFKGWTATDAKNLAADASKTEGEIYKSLLTDPENFTLKLTMTPALESSGVVKVMGVELELDARHGHGDQVCVKVDQVDRGWLEARGRKVQMEITRVGGGDLSVTLTGEGNSVPMQYTVAETEESREVCLGAYAGTVRFGGIAVTEPEKPVPTYTVTWSVNGAETKETYPEGSTPEFTGDTYKPYDGKYIYTFTGWSPAIAPVTADVTYTAQYSASEPPAEGFTVTWDVAGRKTTETYLVGEIPAFKGDTAKADDAMYTYTFAGWDKEIKEATADVTYTAQYTRTLRTVAADGSYSDVKKSDWFYSDVYTATGYGLLKGMGNGKFEPDSTMNRAMLVTVLYRLEGEPTHTAKNPFTDVAKSAWYYDAVLWAAEKEIVNGMGNGKFEPEGDVTREQITAVLMRYAEKKGCDVSRRESIAYFPDNGSVSSYARETMAWAVAVRLMQGTKIGSNVCLDPQGSATRAQVASLLVRFVGKVLN